jgi:hypothetical protein
MRGTSALAALFVAALSLCATVVANASAAETLTLHVCDQTTAGTSSKSWTEATCTATSSTNTGAFRTVPVANATPTEIGASAGDSILTATVGGIAIELKSTAMTGTGNSTNSETGGVMTNTGEEITLTYTGVTVVKPAGKGCSVKGGTTSVPSVTSAASMASAIGPTTVKFSPTSPSATFTQLTIEGCVGAAAILNGLKKIEGISTATQEKEPCRFVFSGSNGLAFAGQPVSLSSTVKNVMSGTTKPVCLETTETGP